MSPFSRTGRRAIAIPSKRRETLKEEIYQTHAFTPNTSPRTTHAPLAFLTAPPFPLPESHKTTNTNSHKIGVTQTDPTGMSHTATTGVTYTDSKAQGAYILTNLKQHFKTERSTVSPTISHPLRTPTHIYPWQPLILFVEATTDRVPR